MPLDTFIGVINFSTDIGCEQITLGGGEASLHPQFRRVVEYILDRTDMGIFMVTNGGKAKNGVSHNIRWLIGLIDEGQDRIDVEMSLDQFHDTCEDARVENWFTRYRSNKHLWGNHNKVRNVGDKALIRGGRALKLGFDDHEWQGKVPEEACYCGANQAYPDGRITGCGCPDSALIAQVVHQGYDEVAGHQHLRDERTDCYSPSRNELRRIREMGVTCDSQTTTLIPAT